jgi:hypothetical protein
MYAPACLSQLPTMIVTDTMNLTIVMTYCLIIAKKVVFLLPVFGTDTYTYS